MKIIGLLSLLLLPAQFLLAELSEDQIKNLEEQEKTYGPVPEREIQYYEETAPQDSQKEHDFYMHDHPLQEKPIPHDPPDFCQLVRF